MKETLEARLAELIKAEKELWANLNFISGRQEEIKQMLKDMEAGGVKPPVSSDGS